MYLRMVRPQPLWEKAETKRARARGRERKTRRSFEVKRVRLAGDGNFGRVGIFGSRIWCAARRFLPDSSSWLYSSPRPFSPGLLRVRPPLWLPSPRRSAFLIYTRKSARARASRRAESRHERAQPLIPRIIYDFGEVVRARPSEGRM